jgi:transglutaminase-like putative cysteine protease
MPAPAGVSSNLDAEGNSIATCWFDAPATELIVESESRVQTRRNNPFDFLLEPAHSTLPIRYAAQQAAVLRAAQRREPTSHDDPIGRLADSLAERCDQQLVLFLTQLCQYLHGEIEIVHRERGTPYSPEETWSRKQGACRDVGVLFMDACRSRGLAARFVSGYHEGDPDDEEKQLHAWAEVYVPGGGWRGFDPALGLAVADRHVAVAAAVIPAAAMPIDGTFRGTGVRSQFSANIDIELEAAQSQQQQQRDNAGHSS